MYIYIIILYIDVLNILQIFNRLLTNLPFRTIKMVNFPSAMGIDRFQILAEYDGITGYEDFGSYDYIHNSKLLTPSILDPRMVRCV